MATPSIGFPRSTATPAAAPVADPTNSTAVKAKTGSQAPQVQRANDGRDQVRTQTSAAATTPANGTSPSALRSQQNAQILQASMDVSIQSGNSSLTLLYRTAIDRINEILAPELGPNAIANPGSTGGSPAPDNSAEGTAGRILSLSTAFYDAYAAQPQNKGKDAETLANDFVGLIRGGFERGFGEAKAILGGLNVLGKDSPVEQGINKTYALVMKGFDDFLASKLAPKPPADTQEPPKDTKTKTNALD